MYSGRYNEINFANNTHYNHIATFLLPELTKNLINYSPLISGSPKDINQIKKDSELKAHIRYLNTRLNMMISAHKTVQYEIEQIIDLIDEELN